MVSSFAQFTVTTVPTNPYCIGGSTGSIQLTASAGTAPYTVQMLSPTVGTVNAMPSNTFTYTGLSAGTYRFQLIDNLGNIQTRDIALSNPLAVSLSPSTQTYSSVVVCDSIDFQFRFAINGTERPNYTFDFWWNTNVISGSPNYTVSGKASRNSTIRVPLTAI
ncbi:MAG: SprB repeat-containing protein, partial [Dolichospermum sp.]